MKYWITWVNQNYFRVLDAFDNFYYQGFLDWEIFQTNNTRYWKEGDIIYLLDSSSSPDIVLIAKCEVISININISNWINTSQFYLGSHNEPTENSKFARLKLLGKIKKVDFQWSEFFVQFNIPCWKATGITFEINKIQSNVIEQSIELDNPAYSSNKMVSEQHSETKEKLDDTIKELSKDQLQALKILETGQNCFVRGDAGTGKSFLIDYYSEGKAKLGWKILKCAFTGMATCNLSKNHENEMLGTIHSQFGGPLSKPKPENIERLSYFDIIIIDEISTVSTVHFNTISKCLEKAFELKKKRNPNCKPVQLIVSGDFYQLAPFYDLHKKRNAAELEREYIEDAKINDITKTINIYAFNSKYWKLFNFQTVTLTENHRQLNEVEFQNNLKIIREAKDTESLIKACQYFNDKCFKPVPQDIKPIRLFDNNNDVNFENNYQLSILPSKPCVFKAYKTGEVTYLKDTDPKISDSPFEKELIIKKGTQIMFVVNDPYNEPKRFLNGDLGIVEACDQDKETIIISVNRTHERIPLKLSECQNKIWKDPIVSTDYFGKKFTSQKPYEGAYIQFPIKLAYAVTIYKAQGQTFDFVQVKYSGNSNHVVYVALSRAKSIKNLWLANKISPYQINTSLVVKKFYEQIDNCPNEINTNIEKHAAKVTKQILSTKPKVLTSNLLNKDIIQPTRVQITQVYKPSNEVNKEYKYDSSSFLYPTSLKPKTNPILIEPQTAFKKGNLQFMGFIDTELYFSEKFDSKTNGNKDFIELITLGQECFTYYFEGDCINERGNPNQNCVMNIHVQDLIAEFNRNIFPDDNILINPILRINELYKQLMKQMYDALRKGSILSNIYFNINCYIICSKKFYETLRREHPSYFNKSLPQTDVSIIENNGNCNFKINEINFIEKKLPDVVELRKNNVTKPIQLDKVNNETAEEQSLKPNPIKSNIIESEKQEVLISLPIPEAIKTVVNNQQPSLPNADSACTVNHKSGINFIFNGFIKTNQYLNRIHSYDKNEDFVNELENDPTKITYYFRIKQNVTDGATSETIQDIVSDMNISSTILSVEQFEQNPDLTAISAASKVMEDIYAYIIEETNLNEEKVDIEFYMICTPSTYKELFKHDFEDGFVEEQLPTLSDNIKTDSVNCNVEINNINLIEDLKFEH